MSIEKKSIQDRIKAAYRAATNPDLTVKAVVIENETTDPAPFEDVHSQNPKIYNVDIGAGDENTELNQALSNGTRRLIIKVRKKVDTTLKIAFVANGTTGNEYLQVEPGGYLDLDGLNLIGKSVYFQADKNNRTIEILELS